MIAGSPVISCGLGGDSGLSAEDIERLGAEQEVYVEAERGRARAELPRMVEDA